MVGLSESQVNATKMCTILDSAAVKSWKLTTIPERGSVEDPSKSVGDEPANLLYFSTELSIVNK